MWAIRAIVDEALDILSPDFSGLHTPIGQPSIALEKLLRALLLQAFYTMRSERQLMEQMDYNLLPVVCGPVDGCAILGLDGVHQEPRASA